MVWSGLNGDTPSFPEEICASETRECEVIGKRVFAVVIKHLEM